MVTSLKLIDSSPVVVQWSDASLVAGRLFGLLSHRSSSMGWGLFGLSLENLQFSVAEAPFWGTGFLKGSFRWVDITWIPFVRGLCKPDVA